MNEEELKEAIARELWCQFSKSHYDWGHLISTYKKPWIKRAERLIERTGIKPSALQEV